MERPPSLNDFKAETGLEEPEAIKEWELLLIAFQKYVKESKDEQARQTN